MNDAEFLNQYHERLGTERLKKNLLMFYNPPDNAFRRMVNWVHDGCRKYRETGMDKYWSVVMDELISAFCGIDDEMRLAIRNIINEVREE